MEEIFPVVVYANHYQFSAASKISAPNVQSRMLLWCKDGSGEVVVNGDTYRLSLDDYLVFPWNHSITYKPDKRNPFLVGGVHLIPNHSFEVPIEYYVPHSSDDPKWGQPERCDADIFGYEGVAQGSFSGARSLGYLAEYTVDWFRRDEKSENEARWLGNLLIVELRHAAKCNCVDRKIPDSLSNLILHIRSNIDRKFSVSDMANLICCSSPTVTRLFRTYLNSSPIEWLIKTRLEQASNQLATTDLPIGEIGRRAGIDDSFYFSKIFKAAYGLTPTAYRNKISMLARNHGGS